MPAGWSVWRRMTFAREGHGARRAIERACGVLGQLDGAAARDLTGTYPIAHVVGQVDGCNAWTRLPHPVSIGRARTGAAPITVHGVEIAPTIRVSRNEPRRWLTRRSSGGVLDPNRGGAIFQYNNTDATSPPEHERSEQRACHPQSTVAICFGMRRTDMVPLVCCRELKMPHSHMPSLSATPAALRGAGGSHGCRSTLPSRRERTRMRSAPASSITELACNFPLASRSTLRNLSAVGVQSTINHPGHRSERRRYAHRMSVAGSVKSRPPSNLDHPARTRSRTHDRDPGDWLVRDCPASPYCRLTPQASWIRPTTSLEQAGIDARRLQSPLCRVSRDRPWPMAIAPLTPPGWPLS